MSRWQSYFEELFPAVLLPDGLGNPFACAMAALLASGAYGGAELVACRGGSAARRDAALLIVDVMVGLGQRQVVNDVKPVERAAITFTRPDQLPSVYLIREGFPKDVPHLNLAPEGDPRSLCLFEMPAEEALRIATPLVLLERVRLWLRETAYGRLHGEDQPLDPVFMNSGQPVVLPKASSGSRTTDVFYGYRASKHPGAPILLEAAGEQRWTKQAEQGGLSAILLATKPLPHARIRILPQNVAELLATFEELGVDLLSMLRDAFRAWILNKDLKTLLEQPCLLVVRTPIERSPGEVGAEVAKAFAADCAAEKLAEALGALWKNDTYVGPPIVSVPPDLAALKEIRLHPMDVHAPFDRDIACAASGLSEGNGPPKQLALVGAGALGSQLALTAARMGVGTWSIIDPDHLMPHNMARHALPTVLVGWAKAEAMAFEINELLGEGEATYVAAPVRDPAGKAALGGAELVIDASASVPVARWLAVASQHSAPTTSVFLSPSGRDLVLLREGPAREPRLDQVEMSYYWTLANEPGLADHLSGGGVGLYPSGGCRVPSLRLPQADVGLFACIAAKRLFLDSEPQESAIEVWRGSERGVAVTRAAAVPFREALLEGWTVSVSDQVLQGIRDARRQAGRVETGGILVGTWDRPRKRAYVVGHYDPPPDSTFDPTGFVRGAVGVYRTLEAVEASTAGNLTYIGEWHTHPPGHGSRPSSEDRVLLRWIGDVLAFSDVQPLMAIAGDDGVRIVMGTPDRSTLFDGSGARHDC